MLARSTTDSDSNAAVPGLGMMISTGRATDTTKVFVVRLAWEPTNPARP